MHGENNRPTTSGPENLLLTAQRKLLKPRLQNKLILAFVFTAVFSIAVSTYLVVRISSQLTENEIKRKIEEANQTALSVIDEYGEQALASLKTVFDKPGFAETIKNEKVPHIFTVPISSGTETPIGLWVPRGQPAPGTAPALSWMQLPHGGTKTAMEAEINGIQTLLAGAVMPVVEEGREYGVLAVGYVLGKSFAQDLEIMTGADIRIFHEKIPAGPSSIFFKGNSYDISERAIGVIKEVASIMREHPDTELIVEGHTDSTGSEKQNYRAGLKRAEAVKSVLVSEGVKESRIETISFGETRPIAPETSEENKALNRRVEFEFKSHRDPLVGSIEDLPMTTEIKQSMFGEKRSYYDRDALLKGDPYRAIYQPLVGYGGKVLGLIFVGIPRKFTFETTVSTLHIFPWILTVGFVLAVILGYTISRGISRPIRSLYRNVLAVADGNLDQHFVAETKDEVGDLGRAFNIMTKKLRQLRELEQEMQRRNRLAALGELSAGVAHEIRNPLGIIKNSAEMLRDRIQDDTKRRELTQYIVEEVNRLNKVVTNFLQFARPARPNLEPIDINETLERTINSLERETRSSNIVIEKSFAENLPPVMADPEQCHQVFLNLCMNAFQAMNGAGTLRVATELNPQTATADGDTSKRGNNYSPVLPSMSEVGLMADISISDTGPGIPPEQLSRIFDPFFSTRDDGVGLGLSLVHKIVENHGGRIGVTSSHGSGTVFVISLPVADIGSMKG